MKPDATLRTVMGWPSYVIHNDVMELCLTQEGGHMAPVTFFADTHAPQMPYYFSPWQMEGLPRTHDYRDMFRGDFLAFPFGMAGGKGSPFHGEAAVRPWSLVKLDKQDGITELKLFMDIQIPSGHLEKSVKLIDGHNAVYLCHSVSGVEGAYAFSHHATLSISPDNEGIISVAPSLAGFTVFPPGHYNPRETTYNFVEGGQRIDCLEKVPTIWKDPAFVDCSHVPTETCFSGAVQFATRLQVGQPGWTCVYFPKGGYVWYALRNTALQPVTHFWMEFGGRFQYPWNGRTMCIAVEDMALSYGPEARARMADRLKVMEDLGVRTDFTFKPDETTNIRHIQGAVQVPEGFGKVKDVSFLDGGIELTGESGKKVKTPLDWQFVLRA